MKRNDNFGVYAQQQTVVEPDVTLTLPADVARTLLRVTAYVAGSPETSYRAHTDAIGRALREAGVMTLTAGTRFNGRLEGSGIEDAK